MKTKRLTTFALCIIWGLMFCPSSFGEGKVGFINIQRLVNESKMGIAAKKNIQKLREEKEAVLALKQKEINALEEEIDKNKDNMNAGKKQDKTEALEKLHKDYQNLVKNAKEEILKQDRELVSEILKKADDILKKVAKRNKFAIILKDPNAIGYMDSGFDITDKVLAELNKSD